jgi:hypothetical protein
MKKIKINTTRTKFHRLILTILGSMNPVNQLGSRELDVLGRLLHYNDLYRDIEPDARVSLILNDKTRTAIREELGISRDIFNNNLSKLRKVGILLPDGKLHPFFAGILYDKEYELTFMVNSNE